MADRDLLEYLSFKIHKDLIIASAFIESAANENNHQMVSLRIDEKLLMKLIEIENGYPNQNLPDRFFGYKFEAMTEWKHNGFYDIVIRDKKTNQFLFIFDPENPRKGTVYDR